MNQKHQEDLHHIRNIMERSSRFISLSGLSGVFAGSFAILGAISAYFIFKQHNIDYFDEYRSIYPMFVVYQLVGIAALVLILSLSFAIFFTIKKSRQNKLPIYNKTTKLLLMNLMIPLVVGGIFCLQLALHHIYYLITPSVLIFYGLALINASKYTFGDIKYLGLCEVGLGLIGMWFLGNGLILWTIGFGVLHIVYGVIMHKKYQ